MTEIEQASQSSVKDKAAQQAQDQPLDSEILANAPVLIITLDSDWRILTFNQYTETITGLPLEQARGKDCFSALIPEHGRDHAMAAFNKSLDDNADHEAVTTIRAADGLERRIEWRLGKLDAAAGKVVAIGVDVTEREWKEEHRLLLSSMVEQSSEGMALVDLQGNLMFLNHTCARMHGYEVVELIGEPFSIFFPSNQIPAADAFKRSLEEKGHFSEEGLHVRRDRVCFPTVLHASALRDETDALIGFVCTMRDTTEAKKAEAALRQSETRLRTVVENAPVVLWAVDHKGVFTLSEGMGLAALGLKPGQVVGQSVFEIYRDIPEILDAIGRALAGEAFVATARVGTATYDTRYSPLVNETGEVTGVIGVSTDISERLMAEKALWLRARQQTAVAEFGQKGLAGMNLDTLMNEAASLVAANLGMEYSKVLELMPGSKALLLRAGVGWKEGYIGKATVSAGRQSQAGYTLLSRDPIIVEDLASETRFSGPPLLLEHGVVSGLSVVIHGRERPFGVLGAHTTRKRAFSRDDTHFLQAIANVLAAAIERNRSEDEQFRLAKAVEQVAENIIVTDLEGTIQFVNPAFKRLTGYSPEEAIGENPRLLKSGRHDAAFYRQMWETITTGSTWRGEFINKRKDGTLYREQATISPVTDQQGKIVNFVAVKRELPLEYDK